MRVCPAYGTYGIRRRAQDVRVPVDQGLQLLTGLRRNNVPARALVFPDEGHWVLKPLNSRRWHEEVFGWLKKYLQ